MIWLGQCNAGIPSSTNFSRRYRTASWCLNLNFFPSSLRKTCKIDDCHLIKINIKIWCDTINLFIIGQVHVFAGRVKIVSHFSCRTSALGRITQGSHIAYNSLMFFFTQGSHIRYNSLMFFIAYAFKGQVHVFPGWVKIVSHWSCRTSAIFKYFVPWICKG